MKDTKTPAAGGRSDTWTFLSNHGHVLVELAHAPGTRLRDLADRVGITERAVQRIVAELVDAGVLTRHRVGRRNSYSIDRRRRLRHPIEDHCRVGDLVDMVWKRDGTPRTSKVDLTKPRKS